MIVPSNTRVLSAFLALSVAAHAGLLALAGGTPWPRVFAVHDESLPARLVVQESPASEPASATLDEVLQKGLPVAQPDAVRTANSAATPSATRQPRSGTGLAVIGTSTVTPAWAMIELVLPFWDAHYGGLPDPDVHPPELLGEVDLGYPATADAMAGPQRVSALVLVSADGRAEHVIVTQGTPPFGNFAEATLADLRFKPAERDGQPVRHYLSLEIDFWPDPKAARLAKQPPAS